MTQRQTAGLPDRVDVLVLGGGPAGLACADEVTRRGGSVLVVERDDEVGGLCRTHRREGFSFDLGGHRFITADREIFDRVRELLGERLRVVERHSVIRLGDREYSYPLRLDEVLRGEGLIGTTRILASYARARLRRRGKIASFSDWARTHFGDRLAKRFFEPYTEKLWGIPGAALSSDWAGQRIPGLSIATVAARAMGFGRQRTFAKKYCYPERGIGEIFEALAQVITQRGGSIACGTEVRSLRAIGRGDEVVAEIVPSGPSWRETRPTVRTECVARRVVSTIPLRGLLVALGVTQELLEASAALRTRSLRFLNIGLEGRDVAERTWIYVPEKTHLMTRVQIPPQRSRGNCPPGSTSVQLEIPCTVGDAIWTASHEDLLERGLRSLSRLGLDVRSRVRLSFDTRAADAYPIYTRGYREPRETVLEHVDRVPWLEACGRQGRFQYIFFDRALREGVDAGRRALGLRARDRDATERALARRGRGTQESRSLIEELALSKSLRRPDET